MGYHPTIGVGGASNTNMTNGITTVECQKQVRSWRLLRSLIEILIPSCNCTTFMTSTEQDDQGYHQQNYPLIMNSPPFANSTTTITGTIFGHRRGKVSFCIQSNNSKSTDPVLVLELAVPTTTLAKEMQGGNLRIMLESAGNYSGSGLLSSPLWVMYCNGRKAGYAVKRRPSKSDLEALKVMGKVGVGAGVIKLYGKDEVMNRDQKKDELMYLRAKFRRVCGSPNSESFHLIDPEGSRGQELSIFFFRSRT